MKIKHFLIIIIFISISSGTNKGFEEYRYNPFQFPYKEYYMVSRIVPILKKAQNDTAFKSINIFGLSVTINKCYFDSVAGNIKSGSSYYYLKNKKQFVVFMTKEELMGCDDSSFASLEKDFCSAFSSSEDLYMKLFTLTPDSLTKDNYQARGYSWIVHQKGRWFKDIKSITIYKGENFVAFRRDFSDSAVNKKGLEICIFHKTISPDWITFGIIHTDEKFISELLSSL